MLVPAELWTAPRERRRRLIAVVASIGLAQVALAGRSAGALPEFWVAVAIGWACAASLWEVEGEGAASGWWVALGVVSICASLVELVPVQYRTPHRFAPLGAGLGLALLGGPREVRRQARALAMLLCPALLPAPKLARGLLDLCPWTAAITAVELKIAGVPAVRAGVELRLPGSTLVVADGCSGLNQILALLFIALFAISLFPTTRVQKIWLLASASVVGFVSNTVRIAALTVFADRGEMQRFAAWHDGALSPLCTVAAVVLALVIWLPLLRRHPRQALALARRR